MKRYSWHMIVAGPIVMVAALVAGAPPIWAIGGGATLTGLGVLLLALKP